MMLFSYLKEHSTTDVNSELFVHVTIRIISLDIIQSKSSEALPKISKAISCSE